MVDESLEDWGERVVTLAYQALSGLDAAFFEQEMVKLCVTFSTTTGNNGLYQTSSTKAKLLYMSKA